MQNDAEKLSGRLRQVFAYHQATKHHFQGNAKGPGMMDWTTQPDPFRRYAGAQLIPLERIPPTDEPIYDDAFVQDRISNVPINLRSISQLFFDSLALSAWKSIGATGWALRVNPSSGNLHPTKGYLICGPIDGLHDKPMVYHYAPKEHGLEVRAVSGQKRTAHNVRVHRSWQAVCGGGQYAERYFQQAAGVLGLAAFTV